jgi:hypothetical protein
VTARVITRKTYPVDSLPARPAISTQGRSVEALTLEIQEARQARPEVSVGPAAGTIEAFAPDPLPPVTAGQRIEATLVLIGDTQAHRWLVSDVRVLGD